MAERKAPQVDPVVDSSEAENSTRLSYVLPDAQFANVIRFIKRGDVHQVEGFAIALRGQLERLGQWPPTNGRPVSGTPDGSDQVDVRSIIVWMEKLQPNYKKACQQLQDIAVAVGSRL